MKALMLFVACAGLMISQAVFGADIDLGVEISEIMYDTPNDYDAGGEWIEIYNDTGSPLDISNWQVWDGANWRTISQESGYGDITNIPAGSYAVICEKATTHDFVTLYDGDPFPDFPTSRYLGRLDGTISLLQSGENIRLRDDSPTPVTYQDFDYPDNAENAALVKAVIRSSEDVSSNWVQATTVSGSPGVEGEDQSLPVLLSSFTALPGDGQIVLHWTTESEIDNLGFDVYRSLEEDGEYVRINGDRIQGAGSSSGRNVYSFTDVRLTNGQTYFYKLEDVSFDGKHTLHGPIRATPKAAVKGEEEASGEEWPKQSRWGKVKHFLKSRDEKNE